VKPETLYAYVARGLIESRAGEGPGRARLYSEVEIESFITRRRGRRDPEAAAAGALFWGLPVVESAVSSIDGVTLAYRGRDAVALSQSSTFEAVAAVLWGEDDVATEWPTVAEAEVSPAVRAARELPEGTPARDILRSIVASLAAVDPARSDTRAPAVRQTAPRLVARATAAFAWARDGRAAATSGPMARRVLAALDGASGRDADAERDVDRALILSAEHELNASSFAARVAASTGADPYAVVLAAMATLGGPMHGGLTDRVEAMVRRATAAGESADATIATCEAEGEPLPGFGHPLYPEGDPRAPPLLEAARARRGSPELERLLALVDAVERRGGPRPTLDFGLVATALSLRLPPGSGGLLFAFGRTAGWLAHAIEQYEAHSVIRPRARYVGAAAEPTKPGGGGAP
jgi:citrate synthase